MGRYRADEGRAADKPPRRYLLRVCGGQRGVAVIQVMDRHSRTMIAELSGDVARHLIESGILPAA